MLLEENKKIVPPQDEEQGKIEIDLNPKLDSVCKIKTGLAPPIGLEPMTDWLTASRST